MKKALLALLAILLSFSLFSCGDKTDDPADPNETPKIENPVSGNPIDTPFVEVPLG